MSKAILCFSSIVTLFVGCGHQSDSHSHIAPGGDEKQLSAISPDAARDNHDPSEIPIADTSPPIDEEKAIAIAREAVSKNDTWVE